MTKRRAKSSVLIDGQTLGKSIYPYLVSEQRPPENRCGEAQTALSVESVIPGSGDRLHPGANGEWLVRLQGGNLQAESGGTDFKMTRKHFYVCLELVIMLGGAALCLLGLLGPNDIASLKTTAAGGLIVLIGLGLGIWRDVVNKEPPG